MDHRSYIKPARRLTVQDRNIENNDRSNMYHRLKIERGREVQAKLKHRARPPHQTLAFSFFWRLMEAALNAEEKMFPVSYNE